MALKKTVASPHGINVNDAYHRVEVVNLLNKNSMSFYTRSYADVNKKCFFEQMIFCDYVLGGANPIAQAYEHLKTMPEFAGATDC